MARRETADPERRAGSGCGRPDRECACGAKEPRLILAPVDHAFPHYPSPEPPSPPPPPESELVLSKNTKPSPALNDATSEASVAQAISLSTLAMDKAAATPIPAVVET